MFIGFVVFGFVYLEASTWASASRVGGEVFSVLAGFAMVYALLTGPLTTADSLARERREETLGLLFLTNLRSYDVVLGKLAAASLDIVLGLFGALPLMAIPFLLGGVSLTEAGCVALAIGNLVVLSLAVGIWASALTTSSRAALGITLLVLSFLTLGLPAILDGLCGIDASARLGPWVYMCCPIYLMGITLDRPVQLPCWEYWLNLGATQLLSWLLLAAACVASGRAWRGLPESRWRMKLKSWLDRLKHGRPRARERWRQMLDRNPITWLEGRERLQSRMIRLALLISTTIWAINCLLAPLRWVDEGTAVLWPMVSHYVFCLWLAIQSPRRLADDKRSGALELLLCTPLKPAQIVRGYSQGLWRVFGPPFLFIMAFGSFLVLAYYVARWQRSSWFSNEMVWLWIGELVVFPIQAWAFARVGIFFGLRQGNSIKATVKLVWLMGLLPYLLFYGAIICYSVLRLWSLSFAAEAACLMWVFCHLVICIPLLVQASRRLRLDFRNLAAEDPAPRWPARLGRALARLRHN